MLTALTNWVNQVVAGYFIPDVRIADVVEIILIAFIIYRIVLWIKNTKAWMLLKGILVLVVFIIFASVFKMYTTLWLAKTLIPVMATGVVVIFQPELRRALEKLGERKFLSAFSIFDTRGREKARFSEETLDGIVRASYAMGAVKTGALIVVEQAIQLTEYESTGIRLDCLVSPQVLINIFEHNTPLHDGAIIVRGDRIVSATCYLPLSDNMKISKELGTRHRAAIGMSEVSDALVIAVSEETGYVSVAYEGELTRNVSQEQLRERLVRLQSKEVEESYLMKLWKGWRKHEKDADKESGS